MLSVVCKFIFCHYSDHTWRYMASSLFSWVFQLQACLANLGAPLTEFLSLTLLLSENKVCNSELRSTRVFQAGISVNAENVAIPPLSLARYNTATVIEQCCRRLDVVSFENETLEHRSRYLTWRLYDSRPLSAGLIAIASGMTVLMLEDLQGRENRSLTWRSSRA